MKRRDVGGIRIGLGILCIIFAFIIIVQLVNSPSVQNPNQPICNNQPMQPGDVCEISDGSSTTDVTYDQMLQGDQQASQNAPMVVLLVVVALIAGVAFIAWGVTAKRQANSDPPTLSRRF